MTKIAIVKSEGKSKLTAVVKMKTQHFAVYKLSVPEHCLRLTLQPLNWQSMNFISERSVLSK